MQATVRSYDPDSRSGTVLADNGVEIPFGAAALAGSRLRHLRIGQRVRVEVDGDIDKGEVEVRSLTIYTLSN